MPRSLIIELRLISTELTVSGCHHICYWNDETIENGKLASTDAPAMQDYYLGFYEKYVKPFVFTPTNACDIDRYDELTYSCEIALVLHEVLEILWKDVQLPPEIRDAHTHVKELSRTFKTYIVIPDALIGLPVGFSPLYMELSFPARLVVYFTVLGTVMLVIVLLLKFLSEYDLEDDTAMLPVSAEEEQRPLMINNAPRQGDEETAIMFSSSEDVDYSKICVICFEERKNCFFVPCGHSATCYGCAQKILSEESKVCPICRRVIRKSRRLLLRR
ncbi:hypothetical protein AALP_AA7G073300 [Arabis alpina]|uniref:RING-type domain-containing protein n=1 Tax=Arabis alpina TaxID=50452 RepID=A0A087GGI1_ARAAL|nr:hypothetical protein AALP_AA7G073300 [Arabis alpina]